MPIIDLKNNLPGMGGLIMFRKEMGIPMAHFVEAVLNGPSDLSRFERELICAYVSYKNHCQYCYKSHSAVAAKHLDVSVDQIELLLEGFSSNYECVEEKLKIILQIAEIIRLNDFDQIETLIAEARKIELSDVAIHDTILTASLASMFNRYVDGMRANLPQDEKMYEMISEKLFRQGYKMTGQNA